MKRKHKKTFIGLDTIEIEVKTQGKIEVTELFSNRTKEKIGTVKQSSKGENRFRISLNIPKMIRKDNIKPFGIADINYLDTIVYDIEELFEKQLKANIEEAIVSTVEINVTAELKNPKKVECIMNLLGIMFSQEEHKKFYITAHGKQDICYKDIPLSDDVLRNSFQIESIKTPRLGNKCFSWKFYDKGLEQNIQNKGIIRFEQKHNSKSMEREKIPKQLNLFLSTDIILELINLYKRSFEKYFINIYWKHSKHCFVDKAIGSIFNQFKQWKKPLFVAESKRNLIAIDFGLFERAVRKYYKNRKTGTQAIRRVKNSGKVEVNYGTIGELTQIFRTILD